MNLAALDTAGVQAWLEGDGTDPRPSIAQALNAVNEVPDTERRAVTERVRAAEAARDFPRSTLIDQLGEEPE